MTEAGLQAGVGLGLTSNVGDVPEKAPGGSTPGGVTETVVLGGKDSGLSLDALNLDAMSHSDTDSDTRSMPPPKSMPPPRVGPDGEPIIPMSYAKWTLVLNRLSESRVRLDGQIKCLDGRVVWMMADLLLLNVYNQGQYIMAADRALMKDYVGEEPLREVPENWWDDWVSLAIGLSISPVVREAAFAAGFITDTPVDNLDSATCIDILDQDAIRKTAAASESVGHSEPVGAGGVNPEASPEVPDVVPTAADAKKDGEEEMDTEEVPVKPDAPEPITGKLLTNKEFASTVKANLGAQSLEDMADEEAARADREALKKLEDEKEAAEKESARLAQVKKDMAAEKKTRDKELKRLRDSMNPKELPEESSESGGESGGRQSRSRKRAGRGGSAGWESDKYKKEKKGRKKKVPESKAGSPVAAPAKASSVRLPGDSPLGPVKDFVLVVVPDNFRDGATAGRTSPKGEPPDESVAGDSDETTWDEVPADDSKDHIPANTKNEQERWDNARARFNVRTPACMADCKRSLSAYSCPGRVDKDGGSDDEEWMRETRKDVSANQHYVSLVNCFRLPCQPYYSYIQRSKLQFAHQEFKASNKECPFIGCKQDDVSNLEPKRFTTLARFSRHLVERHMHHRPEYECIKSTTTKVSAECDGYYSVRRGDLVRHLVALHKKSFKDAREKVTELHDKLWKLWAVYARDERLRGSLKPSQEPFCVVEPVGTGKLSASFRSSPGHKFVLEDIAWEKHKSWKRKRPTESPLGLEPRKQQRLSESVRGKALPLVHYGGPGEGSTQGAYGGHSYTRVASMGSRYSSPLETVGVNTWGGLGNRTEETGFENTTEAFYPHDRATYQSSASVQSYDPLTVSYKYDLSKFPELSEPGRESQTLAPGRNPSGRGRAAIRAARGGVGITTRGGRGDRSRDGTPGSPVHGGRRDGRGDRSRDRTPGSPVHGGRRDSRPAETVTSHSSLGDGPSPSEKAVLDFPGFVDLDAAQTAMGRMVDPQTWVKIENPGKTEIETRLFEKFSKDLEEHTLEFARATTRMAYGFYQEAHVAERDALEARGDEQLMEAMKCASKAESDSLAMKEFYVDEIAKLRRQNDSNNIKFVTATGVAMDKWDGGVDSLRKLLMKHEEEVAVRRLKATTYTRVPRVVNPAPAPVVKSSLQVSPAVTVKVTAEVNKTVDEGAGAGEMETT